MPPSVAYRDAFGDGTMKSHVTLALLFTLIASSVLLASCDKTPTTSEKMVNGTVANATTTDAETTNRVKTALLNDASLKGLNITVVTLNGDVRLTGELESQSQFEHIDQLVRDTEGVQTVHDELTVRQ
jgi:hyperosmotically inducible protein